MLQYARPKNAVKLIAGVVGLAFERLAGSRPEAAPAVQDDLTAIDGIGRTFGRRLNEAGITTFEQLAGLSVEQVRHYTQVAEWQGDPAHWIAQARELTH